MSRFLRKKYIDFKNAAIKRFTEGKISKGELNEAIAYYGVMENQERSRLGNSHHGENIDSGNGTGGYSGDDEWMHYVD